MFFIIKDSLYFLLYPRKLPTLNFRTENLWMNIQPEKLQEKNIHNYLWWHDMPWINISISDINMYKSFWINMWKDYEWLTTNGCGLRRNIFGVHLELFQVIYSSQLPVTGALFRLWYWHSNILVIYTMADSSDRKTQCKKGLEASCYQNIEENGEYWNFLKISRTS